MMRIVNLRRCFGVLVMVAGAALVNACGGGGGGGGSSEAAIAQPNPMAFNINLGIFSAEISTAYSAASNQPGQWLLVPPGDSNNIDNIYGSSTGVDVTAYGAPYACSSVSAASDFTVLMSSCLGRATAVGNAPGNMNLRVKNLNDGVYDVYIYADNGIDDGYMLNGAQLPTIPANVGGVMGGVGNGWTVVTDVLVSGGSELFISTYGPTGYWGTINGIQIVPHEK